MKTLILDAREIDDSIDAQTFLAQFYHLLPGTLNEIRRTLMEQKDVLVTEVFHWPVKAKAWPDIAATLESLQQHSPVFYVIWNPETTDAITYEQEKAKQSA